MQTTMAEDIASRSRRRALGHIGLLAMLACSGTLGGCARGGPLRVVASPGAALELEWLAKERGLVDAGGYAVERQPNETEALDILLRGDAQAWVGSLEQVLRARAAGLDMEVVLLVGISRGADGLITRGNAGSIAALAGKRIAVDDSATATVLLSTILDGAGVPLSAVERVSPGADPVAAWSDTRISAVLCREPLLSRLEREGARRLVDTSRLPPLVMEVLAVRSGLAGGRMVALRALVDAMLRGRQVLRSNPVDSSYRLATRLGMDPADVQSLYPRLLLPDLDYNRYLLSGASELVGACQPLARAVERSLGGSVAVSCDGLFSPRALPESFV